MAKETKAQREARLEAETTQRVAVAKATYTERMMAVLERALNENFEMTVEDYYFKLSDRDNRRDAPLFVAPEWNSTADMDLYSLEVEVELKEEARAEREQKALVRATALAKLTEEERAELGL